MRQLCKGNVAIVKGAVLAGCKAFYGYPITPASEIAEYAALLIPEVGGTFLQAESEVSAINMVYGASSAGQRVMTASSGPGLSLMQEGISYMAGAELPGVIVDVVRGGPGLGNIAPEQSDYFCVVKGGGHGCYRNLVLAPASVQEMFDLTVLAFELADRYRNPVVIMTDGYVGQMMEPLEIKMRDIVPPEKDWAVKGTLESKKNMISSIVLEPDALEAHVRKLEGKYHACPGAGEPSRELPDGRCGHSAGRLRHRLARAALGDRSAARSRREGWPVPPDHAVAISVARVVRDGQAREAGAGGRAEHGNDGGGREAGAQRQRSGGVLRPCRRQRSHGGRNYGAGFRAHGSPRIRVPHPYRLQLAIGWVQGERLWKAIR